MPKNDFKNSKVLWEKACKIVGLRENYVTLVILFMTLVIFFMGKSV